MTVPIFSVPSHDTPERTSGVDFVRVIQPMQYLNGYKDGDVEFKVDIFSTKEAKDKRLDWLEASQKYKVFFFNYTASAWSYAAMGCFARKNDVKIIMDVDDALPYIRPDNPSYYVYRKGSEGARNFISILDDVDHVVTTNRFLKNVLLNDSKKSKDKITVIPNYIDLDLYKYKQPFKNDGKITITHFGSTTHFIDLQEKAFEDGIDRIFKEFPHVDLLCIGAHVGRWKMKWGSRYRVGYGDVDIYRWINNKYPGYMAETDICVAPLSIDTYNKAKSNIKYLEYGAAGKPGVYQGIRQYEEVVNDGVNGYLCYTADDWFNKLSKLIVDTELRRKMGENAFETIQGHQIKNHVQEYSTLIRSVLGT
jgi:glycosyltransferase involved in cell wall biosynthesis